MTFERLYYLTKYWHDKGGSMHGFNELVKVLRGMSDTREQRAMVQTMLARDKSVPKRVHSVYILRVFPIATSEGRVWLTKIGVSKTLTRRLKTLKARYGSHFGLEPAEVATYQGCLDEEQAFLKVLGSGALGVGYGVEGRTELRWVPEWILDKLTRTFSAKDALLWLSKHQQPTTIDIQPSKLIDSKYLHLGFSVSSSPVELKCA